MRPVRRTFKILKRTGAIKVFTGYLFVLMIAAVLFWVFEPNVKDIFDGFWYSFICSTTVGFGDIVAGSFLGRIITIVTTMYGLVVVAMITGVIVNYYTEYLNVKEQETISTFLEKLEELPELSREELAELSEKIKRFNKKK